MLELVNSSSRTLLIQHQTSAGRRVPPSAVHMHTSSISCCGGCVGSGSPWHGLTKRWSRRGDTYAPLLSIIVPRGSSLALAGMKPKHILVLLLLYIAALSGMTSYLDSRGIAEPQWSVVVTSIMASLLVFWWYWADSTSKSYRRSPLLNVAIVAVGFLAVPYYLLRSREEGRRLRAFARMLGFVLLMVVAMVVGALPVALAS